MGIEAELSKMAAECGGVVSIAVRNVENAENLSVNDREIISSASIIKIPMLVEAMRQVRDGELSFDQEFILSDSARVKGAGVMRRLHTGAKLTLKDLLWLMIIVSDNTATNILIDVLKIDKVNSTMRAMGLEETTLQRKMYNWDAIEKGLDNVCTAGEIVDLLTLIACKEAVGGEWDEIMLDMLAHQQDTSRLGLFLPSEARLANKTGSRDGIYHDCGIVTTDAFSYSIAVLTKNAKSAGDAHLAIARISRAIYDYFQSRADQ
ncbi:MAG: class A beta-lactamase-related serine hydrolase [Armatimonadetes bacterium]|nr:class A beta-lactamase-related serine hydrolase [Armatimonadota bacterium]